MSVAAEIHNSVPDPIVVTKPKAAVLPFRGLTALAIVLAFLGAFSFATDLHVSRWLHVRQGLKWLHQPLQAIEGLGDSAGVALVLITLHIVLVTRRRELLRVFFAVIAAGLAADVVKFCIARTRPRSYDNEQFLAISSISETFHGWFPFLKTGSLLIDSKFQSFPSAHTATGAALAIGLTRLFPHAGWWFGVLAAGVALQRVETGAHYLSDTCFGGAVGILVGLTFHQGTSWSKWFDSFETRADHV